MRPSTEPSPRSLALTTLLRIEAEQSYANLSLDAALKAHALSPADKRLATTLVYGAIERRITLDYCIGKLSERPIESLDPKVLTSLRLGLYQLLFLDRIPPHAAVNESVALVGRRAGGFVNACLREFLRQKDDFPFPKREDGLIPYLSVTYSVPQALCEKFLSEFGEADTESILAAFSTHPPLTIAFNPMHGTREHYLALLRHAGIEGNPTPYAPNGITVTSGTSVDALPGFQDGYFFVQDEASQICVEALGALPDETVIDACACPGSKSFGSALRMRNRGQVLSFDLHESKLSLVTNGAKRLGITILTAKKQDGKVFDPALEGIADRVLCDVPCSGYGVMGKKPDIRYKDPKETERLPEIQYAILENSCRYVKPGGVLVYSTCTVFSDENWYNVQKFLAAHPDFTPEDFTVGSLQSENGMLTMRPDIHRTDGFFVAKMRRSKDVPHNDHPFANATI